MPNPKREPFLRLLDQSTGWKFAPGTTKSIALLIGGRAPSNPVLRYEFMGALAAALQEHGEAVREACAVEIQGWADNLLVKDYVGAIRSLNVDVSDG